MKILFSIMRIGSLVAALRIVTEGHLAVCMVAFVWAVTAYVECAYQQK